jgi:hypothetical protein
MRKVRRLTNITSPKRRRNISTSSSPSSGVDNDPTYSAPVFTNPRVEHGERRDFGDPAIANFENLAQFQVNIFF